MGARRKRVKRKVSVTSDRFFSVPEVLISEIRLFLGEARGYQNIRDRAIILLSKVEEIYG